MDGRQPAGPKQCGPAIPFSHEDARRRHGLLQVAGREPISPHDVAGLWRVDLSRLETEWLIACFYMCASVLSSSASSMVEFASRLQADDGSMNGETDPVAGAQALVRV